MFIVAGSYFCRFARFVLKLSSLISMGWMTLSANLRPIAKFDFTEISLKFHCNTSVRNQQPTQIVLIITNKETHTAAVEAPAQSTVSRDFQCI